MATFYVENFGCRATQADGASLERQFEQRGLIRADAPNDAEVVVLNTCTVTAAADHDARAAIRRIHRQNPGARIVVTGCYAQRAPEEIASLEGVTQVIGNSHKHILADLSCQPSVISSQYGRQTSELGPQNFVAVDALLRAANREPPLVLTQRAKANDQGRDPDVRGPRSEVWVSDIFAHTELLAAPVFDAANERTRPNLKIQDGCNNRCSFCVIPYVRGRSRSLSEERIIEEVNSLVAAGYQEVVLSGINLGRWGRDLKPKPRSLTPAVGERLTTNDPRRLPDVIRLILEQTAVAKLRISSVEPMDWTDDLIALVASSPRIAQHAHVPMQSGSDTVLRRMHRKYRPRHYEEKIRKIRAAMPQAAIGADVMVGFPGETDAEFEATWQMVKDLPLTYLHVFTYSVRPNTPAASMKGQVPERVARERNRMLRELAAQKKQAFMNSFLGRTLSAITLHSEGMSSDNTTPALTDNFLKVRLSGRHPANHWIDARVTAVTNHALLADSVTQADFKVSQPTD